MMIKVFLNILTDKLIFCSIGDTESNHSLLTRWWSLMFCILFFSCFTSEIYSWFCFFNFCYIVLNLSYVGHCIIELATVALCSFCVSQGTTQCCNDILQTCNVDIRSWLVHCLNSSIVFLIIILVQLMHAELSGSKENICIHVCKSKDLS